MRYKFKCPKCGWELFQRFWSFVSYSETGTSLHEIDTLPVNTTVIFDGAEVTGFYCDNCDMQLMDEQGNPIECDDAMEEWLKQNGEAVE